MRYESADPGIIVSGLTKPFVLTERKWHHSAELLAQADNWHACYPYVSIRYSRNSLTHFAKLWYASFVRGNLNLKDNISYNYRGLLRTSGILVPSKRKSKEHEIIEQSKLAPPHSNQILSKAHLAPNLDLRIVHLSAAEGIPMLREARDQGVRITAETCFHYLSLAAEEVPEGDTRYKSAPPSRGRANQALLWDELRHDDGQGFIKTVVSDHSPCTPDLKLMPDSFPIAPHSHGGKDGDFFRAWGGVSSLGLGLSVLWTEAADHGARIEDIVRWTSTNTAPQVGLEQDKGDIDVGFDGDVVLSDDEAEFEINKETMFFRNEVSAFDGKTLKGVVEETWIPGKKPRDLRSQGGM